MALLVRHRSPGYMNYELSESIPVSEVRPGTNLLILGPPMTGKADLTLRMMGEDGTENSVIVTTQSSADELLDGYGDVLSPNVGVVDTVSQQRGVDVEDAEHVKYVSSPRDLTSIGIKFSELLDDIDDDGGVKVYVESVSTLLMHMDVQTVFRFLHVFTGQVKDVEGVGLFVINSESHSQQDISKLKQLFDGLIHLRETGDGVEARVEGITPEPTNWTGL